MYLVALLVLTPLLAGTILAVSGSDRVRRTVLMAMTVALCAVTVAMAVAFRLDGSSMLALPFPHLEKVLLTLDMGLSLILLGVGLFSRRPLIPFLVVAQMSLILAGEMRSGGHQASHLICIDGLSLIMALIVASVGGLICIHAVGYMREYHRHHAAMIDGRRGFFSVFCLFLSAMFGLVFANHLGWVFFFWEVTTLCSFLLIAYPRTPEAIHNAFHALLLNLLGGVGFAGAIYYQLSHHGAMELTALGAGGAAMLPVALLSFAGLTKAAQMPFSSWLLGAMVAPTPVSALLHSSTMVKAGVYVILRMAPALQHTLVGWLLALVGGLTFLMASVIAISQSNAKRVLAYSTVANLGLIVACAGAGNPQAMWAALLLLVFHAVSKALLFLSVGTVEHSIGSRDIEDMDGLLHRLPSVALCILIGIAGMFLAPFGMLVSKWAAIEGLIKVNPMLPILIAFGSSATLFFWTKWMGKLLADPGGTPAPVALPSLDERFVLTTLAGMTVLLCALYPLVAWWLIDPYLCETFGRTLSLSRGNLLILSGMLALLALLPLSLLRKPSGRVTTPYLSGANTGVHGEFTGSLGRASSPTMKNYYLQQVFPELPLVRGGTLVCALLAVLLLVVQR